MIRVVLLGAGNVATHLAKAFLVSENVDLIQIYSRSESSLLPFQEKVETTTSLSGLEDADCYIISVPDDAVAGLSESLPFSEKLVAHTSGSVAMNELSPKNSRAVFYPLQTFSKNKAVDFSEIPVCLEAENEKDLALLQQIAGSVSENTFIINSNQRRELHLAAVFVCNFVNYLYQVGNEITEENQLPFDILKPLIRETARKIEHASPKAMQTGPAKRNDIKTIEKHLNQLKSPEHKEIYALLTKAIKNSD